MKCRKCGADIPFDEDICPVCHNPVNQFDTLDKKKSVKSRLIKAAVVLVICAVVISLFILAINNSVNNDINLLKVKDTFVTKGAYSMMLIETAIEFRNEKITPESTGQMTEQQSQAYYNKLRTFWDTTIDGKKPFDLVKERTIDKVKTYAYYKSESVKEDLKMTKDERQAFETLVENSLTSSGAHINNDDPDKYYLDTFGVTRLQYMDYRVDQAVFEKLFQVQSSRVNVTEAELMGQFDNSRDMYASNTVDTIFLSLEDAKGKPVNAEEKAKKKALADEIRKKVESGTNFESLVSQYSEISGKEINKGRYVINKDSIAKQLFGQDFIKWSLFANANDITVVETTEGFSIVKCIAVGGYEESLDSLTTDVKMVKYHKVVADTISQKDYEPQIADKKAYDKITKVPGTLVY